MIYKSLISIFTQKHLKMIKNIFFILLCLLLISIYSWLGTWGIYLGYLGLIVLFFGIFLWKIKGLKYLFFSWIILFFLTIILFPQSIKIYNHKTIDYMHKIESGQGLFLKEKMSIYGLNLLMSAFAYPICPEVSKESFYLIFKSVNGIRNFEDDFFMKSQRIKDGFKNNRKKVVWHGSQYQIGHPESRYALALNPCKLKITEFDTYREFSVEVRVEYPKKSTAVLLNYPFKVVVEEGLFNYLQKENWLHPYKAIWKSTINK